MTPFRRTGETYEGIAFQFCKVATVCVLCGRFALPVAASLCAAFYVAAFVKGKRDTRCIGRYPLAIAAFWLVVVGLWIWWNYGTGPKPSATVAGTNRFAVARAVEALPRSRPTHSAPFRRPPHSETKQGQMSS